MLLVAPQVELIPHKQRTFLFAYCFQFFRKDCSRFQFTQTTANYECHWCNQNRKKTHATTLLTRSSRSWIMLIWLVHAMITVLHMKKIKGYDFCATNKPSYPAVVINTCVELQTLLLVLQKDYFCLI